jgi:GNAT superfamily N-acetyltransferase
VPPLPSLPLPPSSSSNPRPVGPDVALLPYTPFHLAGVLVVCAELGWSSYADDPARTHRLLTAPGVTCRVAVDGAGEVVGLCQLQGDGELQAHVSLLGVRKQLRRRGVAQMLLDDALRASGCERADLLSEGEASDAFYATRPHRRGTGFRVYLPERGARG